MYFLSLGVSQIKTIKDSEGVLKMLFRIVESWETTIAANENLAFAHDLKQKKATK